MRTRLWLASPRLARASFALALNEETRLITGLLFLLLEPAQPRTNFLYNPVRLDIPAQTLLAVLLAVLVVAQELR